MTDYNISRRKVLAGLGTIGVASAGAGLGTTAFFSDEESLDASLEAGRMDILLDYRATYSPWEPYLDDVYPRSPDVDTVDLDGDPGTTDDVAEGPIYVTGQAPDVRDGDGDILSGQRWGDLTLNLDACEDVQTQLDEAEEGSPLFDVSIGDAEYPNFQTSYVDGLPGTMFSLDDVKPKDRGEATMSVHLCDNRAFLWTRPTLDLDDENVAVEPETSAGDVADDETDDFDGELADHLWVSVWYDANCNNVKDTTESSGDPVSVELVLDASGSMSDPTQGGSSTKNADAIAGATTLAQSILDADPNNLVGVTYFGEFSPDGPARVVQSLTDDEAAVLGAIGGLPTENGTPIGAGVDVGQSDLAADTSGNDPIMIFLTDGNGSGGPTEAAAAKSAGTRIITIAYGTNADTAKLATMASSPADAFVASEDNVQDIFEAIAAEVVGGEVGIYEGSLAGLLDYTDRMGGVALEGDPTNREPCGVTDPETVACFDPGVHCFAFEWYLPCFMEQADGEGYNQLPSCYGDLSFRASGNEDNDAKTMYDELVERGVVADGDDVDVNVVQTDHIDFGVEYVAIQCRHRMGNSNPFGPSLA
jgi:predicted ribosomally synthesized peptide with SipW-like signal peptide